jgi:hypothetical protein
LAHYTELQISVVEVEMAWIESTIWTGQSVTTTASIWAMAEAN